MAIKGPPPSRPRAVLPRPPPRKAGGGGAKKGGGAARASGSASKGKASASAEMESLGHDPVNTDEEERIGYERRHAAELDEEGRKHVHGEAEAEARRQEELAHAERMKRVSWGEERKKRGRQNRRDDDDDTEDGEAAAEAAVDAKAAGYTAADGAGKYFQDMPEDRMGDPNLRDPNEMKRVLGPSARFAQHAMLLAQRQLAEGGSRAEAIAYLASLYARVGDRAYANKALREFGPATGILDLYPLEVTAHLLEHVPGFCHKVSVGRVFTTSVGAYEAEAGAPIRLEYPASLRIRGFAIQGGARPGYLLEPADAPGSYRLVFLSPGEFDVLVSALSKDGQLVIEALKCRIRPSTAEGEALLAHEREREFEREVDEPAAKKKDKPKGDLTFHFPKRI